jgi:polyhydroxybutyrate depolymerase
LPLVLNFHGFGSSARQQANYSRLPAKADEEGFLLVSPDGTGEPRRFTLLPGGVPDDVAFARDLLDHLQSTLCVDATRMFSAGMSNGAALSMRIACTMPDRITAVAAVTALVYPVTCPAGEAVAVIAFHGTADPCVPFTGGRSACGAMLPVPPIEQSALNWAKRNGCAETPSITQLTDSVRVSAYSECSDNVAVVLYVVDGGGHTWPGSVDVQRLGTTTQEIDATELIWEFFAGQGNLAQ